MGFQHNKELASESGRRSKRGPSKLTVEAKEMIANLTDLLYEDIKNNLDKLDIKDKAQLFPKLLEYRLAKLRSVESQIDLTTLTAEDTDALLNKILTHDE